MAWLLQASQLQSTNGEYLSLRLKKLKLNSQIKNKNIAIMLVLSKSTAASVSAIKGGQS
jgi:hypothetical protein